jgi:MoxR-like ATPase
MQERQVTVFGETHPLDEPFFVIATQNPIEMEGTYPLPKLSSTGSCEDRDRHAGPEGARDDLAGDDGARGGTLRSGAPARRLLRLQKLAREVPASGDVVDRVARLVLATHPAIRPRPRSCDASRRFPAKAATARRYASSERSSGSDAFSPGSSFPGSLSPGSFSSGASGSSATASSSSTVLPSAVCMERELCEPASPDQGPSN